MVRNSHASVSSRPIMRLPNSAITLAALALSHPMLAYASLLPVATASYAPAVVNSEPEITQRINDIKCFSCEFLTDRVTEDTTGEMDENQSGDFDIVVRGGQATMVQNVVAFCVPFSGDGFLNLVVTDESGFETRVSVPAKDLGKLREVTRIQIPVRRNVVSFRIETNTMLTEIEAYGAYAGETARLRGNVEGDESSGYLSSDYNKSLGLSTAYILLIALAILLCLVSRPIMRRYLGHVFFPSCCGAKMSEDSRELQVLPTTDVNINTEMIGSSRSRNTSPEPGVHAPEQHMMVPQLIPPKAPALMRTALPIRCMPRAVSSVLKKPICFPTGGGSAGPPTLKYLFASPLVTQHAGGTVPVARLDVEAEVRGLSTLAKENKHPVSLEMRVATVESFRNTLLETRELIIHLSTHGHEGGIVLEDGVGRAHLLDTNALKNLLNTHTPGRARLVFLNSCNSFELGHVFLNSGAQAVICTKQGKSVRDEEAKYFTNIFYEALFLGRSISEAFDVAQTATVSRPAGGDSFLLLSSGNGSQQPFFRRYLSSDEEDGPHSDGVDAGPSSGSDDGVNDNTRSCFPKKNTKAVERRSTIDSSSSDMPKRRWGVNFRATRRWTGDKPTRQLPNIPAPPDDFIKRDVDVFALVNSLYKRRLVVLCGAAGTTQGIGKSAVAEEVARWSTLRGAFSAAHIVPLASRMKQGMDPWAVVASTLRGGGGRPRTFSGKRSPYETCVQEIKKLGSALLILDDADHIVQQEHFQSQIQQLLASCGKLHLLVATHQPVHWSDRYKAVHHHLRRLTDAESADLFLWRIGRSLRYADVNEDSDDKRRLDRSAATKALLNHPIQAIFDGNPRRIKRIASRVTTDLGSLYELLKLSGPEQDALLQGRDSDSTPTYSSSDSSALELNRDVSRDASSLDLSPAAGVL